MTSAARSAARPRRCSSASASGVAAARGRRLPAERTPGGATRVVYQIYPRSFQDSDGDGDRRPARRRSRASTTSSGSAPTRSGSRRSTRRRWPTSATTSPTTRRRPALGTLADFDALIAAAHERGLRVLLDLVASPHLDRAPVVPRAPRPLRLGRRRRAAEQLARLVRRAGLDPRPGERALVPALLLPRAARPRLAQPGGPRGDGASSRFWLARGVDGFRVDAVDRLVKDPRAARRPAGRRRRSALPLHAERAALDQLHSRNAPEIGARARGAARGRRRRAAGRRGLPAARASSARYLDHFDLGVRLRPAPRAVGRGPRCAPRSRRARARRRARLGALEPRLPARSRPARAENARAAALLLLTLRGPAFVYQGEEIGMADGPGAEPPLDRAGRDGCRHPMQWEPGAARRLHERRAVAAARSTPARATSPTSAPTRARCSTCSAPDRAAPRARRRARAASTPRRACSPSAAASTCRGQPRREPRRLPRAGTVAVAAGARPRRQPWTAAPASSRPTPRRLSSPARRVERRRAG